MSVHLEAYDCREGPFCDDVPNCAHASFQSYVLLEPAGAVFAPSAQALSHMADSLVSAHSKGCGTSHDFATECTLSSLQRSTDRMEM